MLQLDWFASTGSQWYEIHR